MYREKILVFLFLIFLVSCKSSNQFSSQDVISERPLPDERGIIDYQNYQILVANGNETVAQIAQRLKIDPTKLASYNGVFSSYLPREKEVLALPKKIKNGDLEWNIENARESIQNIEVEKSNIGTLNNPIKHRVEIGDTAYSVARLYNVSVTSLAKWNGLDADLNIIVGRELIIPVVLSSEQKNNVTEINAASSEKTNNLKNNEKKPTKNEPTKQNIEDSKEITEEKTVTKKSTIQKYIRPVDGVILRKYNPTAIKNKNEGIDFSAAPGTKIKSTAEGVVALISEPVGGLGKIILIKHKDSVISIYGRVKDIKVIKGQRVEAGQIIGSVERSFMENEKNETENYLHFELRKGTKSIDPEPLFNK